MLRLVLWEHDYVLAHIWAPRAKYFEKKYSHLVREDLGILKKSNVYGVDETVGKTHFQIQRSSSASVRHVS
jgi:hypothetical protein